MTTLLAPPTSRALVDQARKLLEGYAQIVHLDMHPGSAGLTVERAQFESEPGIRLWLTGQAERGMPRTVHVDDHPFLARFGQLLVSEEQRAATDAGLTSVPRATYQALILASYERMANLLGALEDLVAHVEPANMEHVFTVTMDAMGHLQHTNEVWNDQADTLFHRLLVVDEAGNPIPLKPHRNDTQIFDDSE